MAGFDDVKEGMEVIGADGVHLGTVDRIDGDRIKLTKKDSAAQGQHHYVAGSSVASVDGNKVRLSKKGNEAMH